eukprot:GABW01004486.1.p2 GENE.GABW01004486.1~~GABW01004486.1.p2  ORF type:complete len:62 (-),score=4.36 GABW01004486.1:3-188(-)
MVCPSANSSDTTTCVTSGRSVFWSTDTSRTLRVGKVNDYTLDEDGNQRICIRWKKVPRHST